jgi:hypothetical protein
LKFFTKNIQFAVTAYESNKNDFPIWDIIKLRHLCAGCNGQWFKIVCSFYFQWRLALQATIAVVFIMKTLKILALPL